MAEEGNARGVGLDEKEWCLGLDLLTGRQVPRLLAG